MTEKEFRELLDKATEKVYNITEKEINGAKITCWYFMSKDNKHVQLSVAQYKDHASYMVVEWNGNNWTEEDSIGIIESGDRLLTEEQVLEKICQY